MNNILIIDLGAVWGGQEIYTNNFVDELLVNGYKVTHASSQVKHNKKNISYHHIGFSKYKLISNIKILNKLISENDVVIFNGNRAIQQSFFLSKKKKFYAIKHGPFSITTQRKIILKLIKFIYHILFKKIDKIVCVAKVTYEECQSIAKNKTYFIPNGVKNHNKFIPKKYDNGIKAIYCGRLVEDKGIKTLFDVINHIYKQKTLNIKVEIFGEGPLFDWCNEYIKSNKLSDVIQMKGFVTENDLIYSNANLMLFASRYEGMPLSILEAFSYGIPVLAYSAPGVKDLIKNGENGFLINDETFSPISMVSTFNEIILKNLLDNMSFKVRTDYNNHYTFDKMFSDICHTFEIFKK